MAAGSSRSRPTAVSSTIPRSAAVRVRLVAAVGGCWLAACAGSRDRAPVDAPPIGAAVRDGIGEDVDSLDPSGTLQANWDAFVDPEQLPLHYEWSIGRAPGDTDVLTWTPVSGFTRADSGAMALPRGQRLFVNVRARDVAGNQSQIASSDGVVFGAELAVPDANDGPTAVATAPTAVANGQTAGPCTVLEQHGIRWQFAQPSECGRFANGDWWVLGPVDVVAITPPCRDDGGRIRHGAMQNPDPRAPMQGYDNSMFGESAARHYDAAVNCALDVSPQRPLHLAVGTSLVSTISVSAAAAMPQLETAAVLTCLAQAPPPDSFRPPYCGTDKTCHWSARDLDLSRLAELAPVPGAPRLSDLGERFARPWLDHLPLADAPCLYPQANMPGEGRELADLVGQAALALQLAAPAEDKRTLAIALVQLGIDCHGIVQHGGRFQADGGSGSGRKFPLLLAAALLQDETLQRTLQRHPHAFAEDAQTFVVRETAPGIVNGGHGGYGAGDLGLAEWGQRHADDPSLDQKSWDADPYRRCCTTNAWLGYVLATRIMGLRAAWANDALFDYVDRYVQTEPAGSWTRSWSPFAERMWDRYRPAH